MSFSLLWPAGPPTPATALTLFPAAERDLALDDLVNALSLGPRQRGFVRQTLQRLPRDPAVIAARQSVLADLLAQPAVLDRLVDLMPDLYEVAAPPPFLQRNQHPLFDVVSRLAELELYVGCIKGLSRACAAAGLQSAGLRQLRDTLHAVAADEHFRGLERELPDLLASVRNVASVTVGVNLDHKLRPVQATLLAINSDRFTNASILDRIFGRDNAWKGIGELHSVPWADEGPAVRLARGQEQPDPLMVPLFRDLADVLDRVSKPIAQLLKRYGALNSALIVNLRDEIAFFAGAARLVQRLRAQGVPTCLPVIAPLAARVCVVSDAYSVTLAQASSSQAVVTNPLRLDGDGRVGILTGPNGGGKTTYVQTAGQLQLLAQAGLFVPGSAARVSPVDNIYTHFQQEEQQARGSGRFGEEAQRIHAIFEHASPASLVLLNESLASTSAGESLYLALDLVRLFCRLGARVLFATHLHELAERVGELNAETESDSPAYSLVASRSVAEGGNALQRSFRITAGPPLGRSYARELAARYGVSYAQLDALLTARGVLSTDDAGAHDAGAHDAGAHDAGAHDAGAHDAGAPR